MFFRHFFFDFTANAPCFSTDFVRVLLILGIMKWLLFIFSFLHYEEIIENRNLLWTGKFEKFEQVEKFVEKYCRCFFNTECRYRPCWNLR